MQSNNEPRDPFIDLALVWMMSIMVRRYVLYVREVAMRHFLASAPMPFAELADSINTLPWSAFGEMGDELRNRLYEARITTVGELEELVARGDSRMRLTGVDRALIAAVLGSAGRSLRLA